MKKLVKYITPVVNERKKVNYMKFLTKTVQAVKNYESAIQAARKEFDTAREQILSTYKDPVATQKLGEARDVLTAFEMKETSIARETVAADFAEMKEAVAEFIVRSVPEDFPATLAAIQVKGEKITDFEAASFLKKYEGNYTAYSAVLNVLKKNGKAREVNILTPDNLNDDIAAIEKRVLNWIQNRTGTAGFDSEYYARLFTKDTGGPIQLLAENVEAFLAGGFIINNSH